MESFIQCEGPIFLVTEILKISYHSMLQYNLLFIFVVVIDKPVEVNVS